MKMACLALGLVILSPCAPGQWVQTNGPIGGVVTCFAVSGTNLFAGTEGGVFLSTNNGASWAAVNTGLANTPVTSLAVSGTNLFAGTYGGVFLSTNNGASWTAVNTGLVNTNIQALAVSGANLFAGTAGRGVFRRPLSEMITSVEMLSADLPTRFNLSQNFPNPFNPATRIHYTLPRRSHVTLAVFNTLGQQVAELVNSTIEAGDHEIQFNAVSLASGVYFYRLQAGTYTQVRVMALVR